MLRDLWNRDTAERLFWTALSGALTAVAVILTDLNAGYGPVILAAINYLLILVRRKMGVLPNPGEGLPGLPVE